MDARKVVRRARPGRGGFTLVEMLTVVVIISILASLVTVAAMVARTHMRKSQIKFEINAMEEALKIFKEKYGDYPPDCTDANEVQRFLTRAFPHYNSSSWQTDMGWSNISGDPAAALVFWLGGARDPSTGQPMGFSANPRNPFDNSPGRIGPFFEFDVSRLQQVGTKWYYYCQPNHKAGTDQPYVYFKATSSGYLVPGTSTIKQWGNCRACLDLRYQGSSGISWANPKTFQIRAPGLDGQYGISMAFPYGAPATLPGGLGNDPGYPAEQDDDAANFCDSTTFGDMR